MKKKIGKKFENFGKNFEKKKNLKKNRQNFFFDFPKFFSIEVVYMRSRLRMQNFMIIGQGVPEIQGVTHGQNQSGIHYIDVEKRNKKDCLN